MAMDGEKNDLGWYYREIDTTDTHEHDAACRCGITPDSEMDMHYVITPQGAVRQPLPEANIETRIVRERATKTGPDGEDDTTHLNGIVHPRDFNPRWRPQLRLVPTHAQSIEESREGAARGRGV